MGEIAEDCYDRAMAELEDLDRDPDYYGYQVRPWPVRRTPRPAASTDDFDDLTK